MKRLPVISIVIASFIGVFGALQADRWLERRNQTTPIEFGAPPTALIQSVGAPSAVAPPDFRAAAKKVTPSVVSVDRFDNIRRGFSEQIIERQSGTGSGVIVSGDGVIVTNNHVIQGAQRVRVRLTDRRTFDAKVLGTDVRSDLAVLKIEADSLVPIEVGSSKDVQVGQWAMAIGNPLGFNNTVSVGVVSSLKRNLPIGERGGQGLVDAIQTDAAINPGNSGGALTDDQGRLIGINSVIASPTGTSVGLGFAIPVDRVQTVVADIVRTGHARYPGLGIRYNHELDGMLAHPEIRADLARRSGSDSPPTRGIIVLESGGGAAKAGIVQFDVLLEIAGEPVEGTFDLNRILIPKRPGDVVTVKFWSKGKTKTAKVTLQEIEQA